MKSKKKLISKKVKKEVKNIPVVTTSIKPATKKSFEPEPNGQKIDQKWIDNATEEQLLHNWKVSLSIGDDLATDALRKKLDKLHKKD